MGEREEQIMQRLVSKLKGSGFAPTAASDLMYRLPPDQYIEPLFRTLSNEQDEDIRWQIVCRLGSMGDKRVVEILAETLKGVGRYSRKRETAGRILVKLSPELAEELLIEALNEDSETVRLFATAQLGRIGTEFALSFVTKMLNDRDSSVRRFAKRALGMDNGYKVARTPDRQSLPEDEIERYITELKSGDSSVRHNAAGMLHDIGDERAIESLIAALNDEDGWVRYIVVFALEKLGDAHAISGLQWIAENDDYEDFEERKISDAAIEAIAHIKTREYILTGKEL